MNYAIFPYRLTGNIDPHNYTNTSGTMDSELDVGYMFDLIKFLYFLYTRFEKTGRITVWNCPSVR